MPNPTTPPASQGDEALVEELARALWIAQGWRAGIWDGTDGARWTAYGEERKPKWRKVASAILPILSREIAAARADEREKALEEAARVAWRAEPLPEFPVEREQMAAFRYGVDCAYAVIRSLIKEEPK